MTIKFKCPACQKLYDVPKSLAGKTSRCGCGHQFTIPRQSSPESSVTPQHFHQWDPSTTAPTNSTPLPGLVPPTSPLGNSDGLPPPPQEATVHSNALGWKNQINQPTAPKPKLKKWLIIGGVSTTILIVASIIVTFLLNRDDAAKFSEVAIRSSEESKGKPPTNTDENRQAGLNSETQEPKPFVVSNNSKTTTVNSDINSRPDTKQSVATNQPVKPDAAQVLPAPDLSDQEQAGKFVFDTMALLREGNFEKVLPRAQTLIDAEFFVGTEFQARAYDGLAKQNKGSIQRDYARKAIDAYTRLLEKDSDTTAYAFERGVNYGRLGEWEKAIDDLGIAVNHPDISDKQRIIEILKMRAYAFEQLGNSEQAAHHQEVIEGIKSGELEDHISLFLNQDRRYVAEFSNADFVFSLQEDGNYLFFPLGLTMDIKVDAKGNVTGSVAKGTFNIRDNYITFFPNEDQVIEGVFINDDLKVLESNYDFGKRLVGRTFEYLTPEEFIRHSNANKGGNGHHIKEPHEMFHRFILALDGGNMDVISEFTYLGLGPKETIATLKAVGNNPKISRVWLPGGKAEPDRALQMIQELDEAKDTLKESKFDTATLKFFVLSVPEKGDLVANIGDKNGVLFTVYFNDIYMTPMGLKLFGPPRLRRKR